MARLGVSRGNATVKSLGTTGVKEQPDTLMRRNCKLNEPYWFTLTPSSLLALRVAQDTDL